MNICIFEDAGVLNLSPVNELRHTSELICGAFTLKEKIENVLSDKNHRFILHVRSPHESRCREIFPGIRINQLTKEDTLFLNSRIIYSKDFIEGLLFTLDELENICLLKGKTVTAAYVSSDKLSLIKKKIEGKSGRNLLDFGDFHKSKLKEVQLKDLNIDENEELAIIDYPSDLIIQLESQIQEDLELHMGRTKNQRQSRTNAEIMNRKQVFVAGNCNISSRASLDASKGTIYISPNVTVEPFTYIQGPVYIGTNTLVRAGSKLYGPLSIGENCKVSGEITSSIIHSYFNKQHHGFLGHSYLCEWVNLGAGTTTSNLKNNYSQITAEIRGRKVETGTIFLGSIIGDHTKTGINTMLNTGSIIGISSNLFGGGFLPKNIESFSWADADTGKTAPYEVEKAIATAKISMKRRNVQMSRPYENLLRHCFKKLKRQ